ncbi:MAG: BTAD domain-containing putative transcriptional regulator [Actinomycetales bacterium]
MQRRFEVRALAVVASAGFGKSTLLAQAFTENRLSPRGLDVWVGCTSDHDALSVLLTDLLAGLDAATPADLPTDPVQAARLVAEAVVSLAPQQIALLLDDVHTLTPNSPGARLVHALPEHLPATGHLVLSTRPPLRVPMMRDVAAGRALIVREDTLAFAAAELASFADSRRVPTNLVHDLDGWPALAELVASTGRRELVDYLWQEVLAGLREDQLCVLQLLARVHAADDALLTDLLQRPVTLTAVLADLPLTTVTAGGWWSVHPLWQQALAALPLDPHVRAALTSAPAALADRGMIRQAVRLTIDLADWQGLEPVVIRACSGIAAEVSADVLMRWYARLPAALQSAPVGQLLLGSALKGEDPATAGDHFDLAARGFRQDGNVDGELAALVSLFHVYFWQNRPEVLEIVARWQELAAQAHRASVFATLGRALLAPSPAAAKAELAHVGPVPPGPNAVLVGWLQAHLLLTMGEAAQAATFAREVVDDAAPALRSSVRCELVEAHRLLGEIPVAREHAGLLLDETDDSVVRSPRHLLTALILAQFTGATGEADTLLQRIRHLVTVSHLPWAPLAGAFAEAAVAAGDDDLLAARLVGGVGTHRMANPLALLRICPATLILQYVLDPASRDRWDGYEITGELARSRVQARAVVALREGTRLDAVKALDQADLPSPGQLPIGWTVLVGVGLLAAGRTEGVQVVRQIGSRARPLLHRLGADDDTRLGKAARKMLTMVPAVPTHSLTIRVLGPLSVTRDGVDVDHPHLRRERVRQLLGLLAVRRAVPRHTAAGMLWPDVDETVAARNLRVTLNYLQQVLEPDRDERDPPYFLRARGTMLELHPTARLTIDLWRLEEQLDRADHAEQQGTPTLALSEYRQAAGWYRGDLCADLTPEPWIVTEQDRVRTRVIAALVRAGNLLLATGEPGEAQALAHTALSHERWSEEAYHVLVRAEMALGDRASAMRSLDRCFEMLGDLDVPAQQATFDLQARLRAPVG